MNVNEAIRMLENVADRDEPAAINPAFTVTQVKRLVLDQLRTYGSNETLSHLYLKRVWQIVKNQKRPRYGM